MDWRPVPAPACRTATTVPPPARPATTVHKRHHITALSHRWDIIRDEFGVMT